MVEDNGEIVSLVEFNTRIPKSLKMRVKARAAERDIDMQVAAAEALDRWLGSPPKLPAELEGLTAHQRSLVLRYAELLRNGDDEAAIKVFAVLLDRYTRARAVVPKNKKVG